MALALKLACLIAYCTAVTDREHAESITQETCSNSQTSSPAPPVRPESRLPSSPGPIEGDGPSQFGYAVDNALQHASYSRSRHGSQPAQACHSNLCPGKSTGTVASRFSLLAFVHPCSTLVAARRSPCRAAAESTLLSRSCTQAQTAKPSRLGQVLQVWTPYVATARVVHLVSPTPSRSTLSQQQMRTRLYVWGSWTSSRLTQVRKPVPAIVSAPYHCQVDWRIPPASPTPGLMLVLPQAQTTAGCCSLLSRSGTSGPTGHYVNCTCYLSLRSVQHICLAYWRTPPVAHQPGARSDLRTPLIVCETPLSATVWQVWQKQETEDQLPTYRYYLLESVLPGGDPWTRPNPFISYLGKLLSRVIICNFEQLSTPHVRHPHARHMQGVEWNTSPSKHNGNARWRSLTLPMLTMLDWLYKSPGNMPHKYMCPLSGVSVGYWMMIVPRGDSGVQWSERWPYTPDPYRIRDYPQYMPWIGLTVSVDTAFAPRQSDDSSGSPVEAFHLWISAKCCGACMQTLRTAQPCEGTYLCITCRVTAPPHPHVARLVKPSLTIWMADRPESFVTVVATYLPRPAANNHRTYTVTMLQLNQDSNYLRFTASVGLAPSHVLKTVQLRSQIFPCRAAKISHSSLSSAVPAGMVDSRRSSVKSCIWPWLASLFNCSLAAVGDSSRGRRSYAQMITKYLNYTRWRYHCPTRMPGAEIAEGCLSAAIPSQALDPQQNYGRAHKDQSSHNGGTRLLPKQTKDSDCTQAGPLSSRASSSPTYVQDTARILACRIVPSQTMDLLKPRPDSTSPYVIRHQGGAQGRASESNTRSAAEEAQRHARAPLGPCRFVHCASSHLHHNNAHPAAIAWQYSYLRLSVRKLWDEYQLALIEPALHLKCNLRDLYCLQRPDQSRRQQTQILVYTGRQCTALPVLTLPVTCLAHGSMQLFSFPVNTWARVFLMDPDPKSRQRRRPPSRFRTGQVPLRLWTPQDPARGIRLEQERQHSHREAAQRNQEQGRGQRREQWDTRSEAGSWWSGWSHRSWNSWSWAEHGTSWSDADWRGNRAGDEGTGQQESSSSGLEPASLELQRMAARPIEPIVEEELESNDLPGVSGVAEQPGEANTEELQIQVEPSAQEPAAAPAEVAIADPTDEGHRIPQHWGFTSSSICSRANSSTGRSRLLILRMRATCYLSIGDQRPPLCFLQCVTW